MQRKLGFLKRGASNQQALRGVVKNYKMLVDYTLPQAQPWLSRENFKFQIHKIKRNLVLDLNLYTPHYLSILVLASGAFIWLVRYLFFQRGTFFIMPAGDMRHKEFYAFQFEASTNSDDSFDSVLFCWNSDPLCGIDVAPKRPQETLKDPQKNLTRMHWDPTVNPHIAFNGGYYS